VAITINLNDELVKTAQAHSSLQNRSIQQQIEYWAKIGQIVEENPELNFNAIKEILLGIEDVKAGNVEEYKPVKQ
jgi:hypothetical protein